MPRKLVLVVVNKWFECDPVMAVLLNDNARPADKLGWPDAPQPPRPQAPKGQTLPPELRTKPVPRAVFHVGNTDAEVWCVSDFLQDLPNDVPHQSNTQLKAERLEPVLGARAKDAALVVAVGTAAYPSEVSRNGNVCVGTKVFAHSYFKPGEDQPGQVPPSRWEGRLLDRLTDSALGEKEFATITDLGNITDKFVAPPLNPAPYPAVFSRYDAVSLGTVNVTSPALYDKADAATLAAFAGVAGGRPAASVETTHGLIRSLSDAPFLFVSGVVNRVGYFGYEVAPRPYLQNTAGAANAGVALTWMLPKIADALG